MRRRKCGMRKIFNADSVLGAVAFLAMISVPAACEGGMYMTAAALTAVFAVCAFLAVRELGIKK